MTFSKNFTVKDLTATGEPFANVPNIIELDRIQALVDNVLQPLVDLYKKPFKIKSGYRSVAVNKSVGGNPNSQHRRGEAVDITGEDNAFLFHLIKQYLPFDQLRWEGGNHNQPAWVHVSYSKIQNRYQVIMNFESESKM